jgi:pyridoxal phosphate enzyme (YggS family)
MTDRLAELGANLAAVRSQIAAACSAAGRDPAEISLIAITKTFPVSDIMLLSRLGVADIGENRDAEAAPKAAASAAAGIQLRWHFVGQLQVNKAGRVAAYANMVHSVDRIRLAEALGRRASAAGRVIGCLVQVSLDDSGAAGLGGSGRGGADPAEVPAVAAAIAAQPSLLLAGVMGIAPLGKPARPAYARLRELAETVRAAYPDARVISAGMSADMGEAIAEGATHVRIGTALLGGRRPLFR